MPLGLRYFVGIDPGKSGAVAVLCSTGDVAFHDMPIRVVKKPKKGGKVGHKRMYVVPSLVALLRGLPRGLVVLEAQQAMPLSVQGRAQGTVSSFETGYGYGLLRGILSAVGRTPLLVRPVKWKRLMLKGHSTRNKDDAETVAVRLFPHVAPLLRTKRNRLIDGRAEALLLAYYGSRLSTMEIEVEQRKMESEEQELNNGND